MYSFVYIYVKLRGQGTHQIATHSQEDALNFDYLKDETTEVSFFELYFVTARFC